MKTVIVIFGNSNHGKDTFADMLKEELILYEHKNILEIMKSVSVSGKWPMTYDECAAMVIERFGYADPVKSVGEHLIGIPHKISYGSQEDKATWKRYGKTAREWLQWIGTELGRDMVDKNIWIQRAADRIQSSVFGRWFIISDGRFNNELELYKYVDKDIKVYNTRIIRSSVPVKYTHPSETELTQMGNHLFDWVIENDYDLEALKRMAVDTAKELVSLAKV